MAVKPKGTLSLKEWAAVCRALDAGDQVLLLRKGGIGERRGFEVVGTEFLLFPTFEHQHGDKIRPEHRRHFEDAMSSRPPEGRLVIEHRARVRAALPLTEPGVHADPEAVFQRTAPFHIYNREHVAERLAYRPQAPLVAVVLEVRRLAAPLDLADERRYAGCRSWVDLPKVTFEAGRPASPASRLEACTEALRHLAPAPAPR